jgi:hypothetical protein
MGRFIIFIVVAGVGTIYLWQKHNEPPSSAKPTATAITHPTPAPRGQASEYNWMKRSLDRARDVTEESQAPLKETQEP